MKMIQTNKKGQTMIEYALIAALISIAAIAVLTTLGPTIAQVFTDVQTAM